MVELERRVEPELGRSATERGQPIEESIGFRRTDRFGPSSVVEERLVDQPVHGVFDPVQCVANDWSPQLTSVVDPIRIVGAPTLIGNA